MTPFAAKLQAARRRQGWTQTRLAIAAGLHPGTVCHYELGTREPTWNAVQQLAAALGVPVDTFAAPPKPLKVKPKPAKKTAKPRPTAKAKVKRK